MIHEGKTKSESHESPDGNNGDDKNQKKKKDISEEREKESHTNLLDKPSVGRRDEKK